MSPITISLWMPCLLSCKSKSGLAKPLEPQTIAAMFCIPAAHPKRPKQVGLVPAGVHASGIVEHLADRDAVTKQFGARSLNVENDQVHALRRAGRRRGDVPAEDDRASGARRRELDHAEIGAVVVD